jgi:hypothetical protein
MDSWFQPGNSSQSTATQRLRRTSRPKTSGEGSSGGLLLGLDAAARGGAVAGTEGAVLTGTGAGEGEAQATNKASRPHSMAFEAPRANRLTVQTDMGGDKNMWLILLEALAAGSILVLIVWWTMLSGPPKDDDSEDSTHKD